MKKILTFVMLLVMVVTLFGLSTVEAATPSTLYLQPSSEWKADNARFAAYFFGNGEKWVDAVDSDADGFYEVAVPTGFSKVIFCRMTCDSLENNWNNKWSQTADLTIPTDGNDTYYVQGWDAGNWGTKVAAPEVITTVSLNGPVVAEGWSGKLMTDENADGIYELTIEVAAGTHEFKVVVNGSWFGNSGEINDTTGEYQWVMDGSDNCKLIATGGSYTFYYNVAENKLSVVKNVVVTVPTVSELLTLAYNEGTYTRNTHINLATENNEVKADFYQHFHNAQNGTNVFADRTTNFCGDYLYFEETGVGFGTKGENLTEFTWVNGEKTNEKVNANLPGMEEYFTTLFDFQTIEGWNLVDGVYVNTTEEAINAAVAFTAPGWNAPKNYMTYTQVTISYVDDSLVIGLWVSSQADATKLVEGHTTSGTNSLFSTATIKLAE